MMITSATDAARSLSRGEVLAYPTEAVWGLGCDPFNEQAFNQILKLKQRPIEKGVILLAGHLSQVEHLLARLDSDIRQQVMNTWTNPSNTERATTWLLPADEQIPSWIKGNHPQVAVRVTNHPLCIELCNAFQGFIVSTSANPAGLNPARSLTDAQDYFGDAIHYLNGELGTCREPSRIIDAITGNIIRD